jgi:hypothetical protein
MGRMRKVRRAALDDDLGMIIEFDAARVSLKRFSVDGDFEFGSAMR